MLTDTVQSKGGLMPRCRVQLLGKELGGAPLVGAQLLLKQFPARQMLNLIFSLPFFVKVKIFGFHFVVKTDNKGALFFLKVDLQCCANFCCAA